MKNKDIKTIIYHMKEFINSEGYDINIDDFKFECVLFKEAIMLERHKFAGYRYTDVLLVKAKKPDVECTRIFAINTTNLNDVAIDIVKELMNGVSMKSDDFRRKNLIHLENTSLKDRI